MSCYSLAAYRLFSPYRVAFALYCVAPTNSEYRVSLSVSTGLRFASLYRPAILMVALAPRATDVKPCKPRQNAAQKWLALQNSTTDL